MVSLNNGATQLQTASKERSMQLRNLLRAAQAVLCAVALGFAGEISADEIGGSKSVAEELLEILRAAGTINDSQFRDLSARAREEEALRIEAAVEAAVAGANEAVDEAIETAALTAADAAQNPEPDPKGWKFKWSNGFNLRRNDDAFNLKFGGRIQNDWAVVDLNRHLEDTIGGEGHGTEFRRARIFLSGTVYDRVLFKAQYDFANTGDGKTDFKDVYIGLMGLGPIGTVLVGHQKEPLSIVAMTSSKYVTFMERSLADAFSPSRNTGFSAFNNHVDKRIFWHAGAFKDSNDSGFGFEDDGMWNLTGRLVGVPLYEGDGEKVVHLGFGYSHQFRGGNDFMLRYRRRPESHLAPYLASTGSTIPTNNVDIINPEIAIVWGPASFQAEYTRSWVRGDDGMRNTTFWAGYAELSYFLTGERRSYRLGKGDFGRVTPSANFNPLKGDWGAFQIATRFSYLDLNDEFTRGGKMWDITAGINWHLFSNTRVSLNYVHSELDNRLISPDSDDVDGNADIVQARFQLDF
jgi:phosphate-selective porin OprO/OprP